MTRVFEADEGGEASEQEDGAEPEENDERAASTLKQLKKAERADKIRPILEAPAITPEEANALQALHKARAKLSVEDKAKLERYFLHDTYGPEEAEPIGETAGVDAPPPPRFEINARTLKKLLDPANKRRYKLMCGLAALEATHEGRGGHREGGLGAEGDATACTPATATAVAISTVVARRRHKSVWQALTTSRFASGRPEESMMLQGFEVLAACGLIIRSVSRIDEVRIDGWPSFPQDAQSLIEKFYGAHGKMKDLGDGWAASRTAAVRSLRYCAKQALNIDVYNARSARNDGTFEINGAVETRLRWAKPFPPPSAALAPSYILNENCSSWGEPPAGAPVDTATVPRLEQQNAGREDEGPTPRDRRTRRSVDEGDQDAALGIEAAATQSRKKQKQGFEHSE